MLIAKFIVPVVRRIHTNIPKCSSRNNGCSKNVSHKKPQSLISSKCKEYRERLAQCPKSARKSGRCKWQFLQSTPECKIKHVVDDYEKVQQDVTNRAKSIINDFQNESSALLNNLKKSIEASKNAEEKQLEELSHNIKKKVQKLLVLDPPFGSCKRKLALLLQHRTRQDFKNLRCDVLPRIKRIRNIVDNLERDMLISIDRAKSLILSCRKCKNSAALEKCIEDNAKYVEKILEKNSQSMQLGLKKAEKMKGEILDYYQATMAELMNVYREKNKALSKHLDDCICDVKNKKKR